MVSFYCFTQKKTRVIRNSKEISDCFKVVWEQPNMGFLSLSVAAECCWCGGGQRGEEIAHNCQKQKSSLLGLFCYQLENQSPEISRIAIFWKVHQLWAGQGHQNSYLAKLKNCHNISLLPSCHTIEVLNSTVNVITFKIKSGLFGTWFRQVDLLDLPTP